MKQALEMEADLKAVSDWLNSNSHAVNAALKDQIATVLWAYREVRERNEILTKVLIEAAARGIELRAADGVGHNDGGERR